MNKELSGDPDDAESGEFVMVRTEERWLPKEMVDAWDEGIDELKKKFSRRFQSAPWQKKDDRRGKNQILALLNVVDQALDNANQATNSQVNRWSWGQPVVLGVQPLRGGKMAAVAWGVYSAQVVGHNPPLVSLV